MRVVEMRDARDFPRPELVGIRLAHRDLAEDVGFRQQLPDLSR